MIFINKSQPGPPELDIERAKNSGKYNIEPVLNALKEDFFDKCYICEYKNPPYINVEHFISHQDDHNLKFDWNNLFWVCGHCNNIKLAKFDNLLNCTNPNDMVEEVIKLKMDPYPLSEVEVIPLIDTPKVNETVSLLKKVYNGHTPQKTIESYYIRQEINRELLDFANNLRALLEAKTDAKKKICLIDILEHLDSASPFTAFKRWIIKENPLLEGKLLELQEVLSE